VVHGRTSLVREGTEARRLLGLSRGHWGIENRLHDVKEETLGEDRCRVRTGAAPQVLAAIGNAVAQLLEDVEANRKAAATRRFAVHPEEALPLLLP
jgi:predicted transposase YbfD/YdcC